MYNNANIMPRTRKMTKNPLDKSLKVRYNTQARLKRTVLL